MLIICYETTDANRVKSTGFDVISNHDDGAQEAIQGWCTANPGKDPKYAFRTKDDLMSGMVRERVNFECMAPGYGLAPSDYMAQLEIAHKGRVQKYELVAVNPRRRKYVCTCRNVVTGEEIGVSLSYTKALLERARAAAGN